MTLVPKKKILLFSEWYEPAYRAGGPIVSVRNLAQALKKDFQVLVVTGCFDLGEKQVLSGIAVNEIQTINGVDVQYLHPSAIHKGRLNKIYTNFSPDIVWVSGMFSFRYSIIPTLFFFKKTKVIVSPRGMLHTTALSLKKNKKLLFLFFFKLLNIPTRIIWHATNEIESNFIKEQFGDGLKIFSQTNLAKAPNLDAVITKKPINCLKLMVLGRIAEEKNVVFALDALRQTGNKEIVVDFYGNDGCDSYSTYFHRELATLKGEGYKVAYMGSATPVQLDEAVFPNYHYMYLPSSGENFGHAISDSIANKTPVFISDKTPWNEIQNHGGLVIELNVKKHADVMQMLFLETTSEYDFRVKFQVGFFEKNESLNKGGQAYVDFLKELSV